MSFTLNMLMRDSRGVPMDAACVHLRDDAFSGMRLGVRFERGRSTTKVVGRTLQRMVAAVGPQIRAVDYDLGGKPIGKATATPSSERDTAVEVPVPKNAAKQRKAATAAKSARPRKNAAKPKAGA